MNQETLTARLVSWRKTYSFQIITSYFFIQTASVIAEPDLTLKTIVTTLNDSYLTVNVEYIY